MKRKFLSISAASVVAAVTFALCSCGGADAVPADTAADTAAQPAVDADALQGPIIPDELKYDFDLSEYVTLPDHASPEIACTLLAVTDDDVDAAIESALNSAAEAQELADGAAGNGDRVTYDLTGVNAAGETVDEAKGRVNVIGSKIYLAGFGEQLIGMRAGDEKTFDYTFADDYFNSALAGQTVTYTVKMSKVERLSVPELEDYVAGLDIEGVTDVDSYRAYVRGTLEEAAEADNAQTKRDAVYDYLLNGTDISSFPQVPREYYIADCYRQVTSGAAAAATSEEEYIKSQYGSRDAYDQYAGEYAANKMIDDMIVLSLSREYGIEIDRGEYEKQMRYGFDNYASAMGVTDIAKFEKLYSYDLAMTILKMEVLDTVAAGASFVSE